MVFGHLNPLRCIPERGVVEGRRETHVWSLGAGKNGRAEHQAIDFMFALKTT